MLDNKQATVMAQLHEPLRHEPALEAERILMVDLAATQAQDKGAAPSANCEGDQTEGATAKHLNMPPPFSANGVDRLYH
jgi:hypothetical protein